MPNSLRVEQASKSFPGAQQRTVRGMFIGEPGGGRFLRKWSLQDISFEIGSGDCLALIGGNGAGKTTLLRCILGSLSLSSGLIQRPSPTGGLLELGVGFHPELSGRENLRLACAIAGYSSEAYKRRFDEIVGFTELEAAIDAPIRTYSAGMLARLSFAVTVFSDVECLVLDEVLFVGDTSFQSRCRDVIAKRRADGGIIVLATHDLSAALAYCNLGLVLEKGRAVFFGEVGPALEVYASGVRS
jgi:ABC-type polysaccharide/polyol phosphate transport system ATPase subunit